MRQDTLPKSVSSSKWEERSFCFSMTLRNSPKSVARGGAKHCWPLPSCGSRHRRHPRKRKHAPMEPLAFSSTSLIIWKSSSSVGCCPMAESGRGRQAEGAKLSRNFLNQARPGPTLQHFLELPHLNGSAVILVVGQERIAAAVDFVLSERHGAHRAGVGLTGVSWWQLSCSGGPGWLAVFCRRTRGWRSATCIA